DSIGSIRLASRVRGRGLRISVQDIFEYKTVAELARVAAMPNRSAIVLEELPGGGTGTLPLLPVASDLVDMSWDISRFSQSMAVDLPVEINQAQLVTLLSALIARHDALRARLVHEPSGRIVLACGDPYAADVAIHRVALGPELSDHAVAALLDKEIAAAKDRLDPYGGVMLQAVWLDPTPTAASHRRGTLTLVVHHLAVDGVSWRIIVGDLATGWQQVSNGHQPAWPEHGTSLRRWAHGLSALAEDDSITGEAPLWRSIADGPDPLLAARPVDPTIDRASTLERVELQLSAVTTEQVLVTAPNQFFCGPNEILLTTLALAVVVWRNRRGVIEPSTLITLEHHGRQESLLPGADLSQTVGWFTSAFPVRLDLAGIDPQGTMRDYSSMASSVKAVKEQLAAIPNKGIGYGLLRHLNDATGAEFSTHASPQIRFNYLGRVIESDARADQSNRSWLPSRGLWQWRTTVPDAPAAAVLDVTAIVIGGQLGLQILYPTEMLSGEQVEEFAELWRCGLTALAGYTATTQFGGHTPSDFELITLPQSDVESLELDFPDLVDVWPLTPLQFGLMYHAEIADSSLDVYVPQYTLTLVGYVDIERMRSVADVLVDRHANLRTAFTITPSGVAAQVVLGHVHVPWTTLDLVGCPDVEDELSRIAEADRTAKFDLSAPPLIRFTLIRVGDRDYRLVITSHHIVLDGWSTPLLLRDLLALYGDESDAPTGRPFRDYLVWLATTTDTRESMRQWQRALAGLDGPTLLSSNGGAREITVPSHDHAVELDEHRTALVVDLARRLGVTVNMICELAWAIVLGLSAGRNDVVFGTTVSGRPAELTGVADMVGLFVNTVPVRVRLDNSESIEAALTRLHTERTTLLAHHHLGLNDIQNAVGLGPLFDTMMVFQSYPIDIAGFHYGHVPFEEFRIDDVTAVEATHYPVSVTVKPEHRLGARFTYRTDAFEAVE
ncbi:condensation domain-containing protein, partial [Nocardia sp. R7R-8]|uniref:condensation domain-containing protein n=1 Tax=Nocardia sp. R7R-8 TaxID=3459304 RepID=UPI00403D64CC